MDKDEIKTLAEQTARALAKSLLKTRNIIRVVLIALLLWYFSNAALWVIGKITNIILLVILAVFLAYLLDPLVDFLEKPFASRGRPNLMPRPLAVAIVYLAIFGVIGTSLYILVPKLGDQITQFVKQVPSYKDALQARADKLNEMYQNYNIPEKVREGVNEKVKEIIQIVGGYLIDKLPDVFLKILEYLPWMVLVPVLAFFLLKDASSFHDLAIQAFPSGVWRVRAEEFFQDVNKTLAAYIRAQLIACFLIGGICFIGFYFIGVQYALLLAVIAGFLEFIPLVGPLVVAILAASIASYYNIKQAAAVIIFLVVLRIVHDYVTYPRIIREGIHLHPIAIILAILAATELAGIAGVFLAIPVVALATVAYRHYVKSRGGTGLVADILQEEELNLTSEALVIARGDLLAVNVTETKELHVEVEKTDEEDKS